MSRLFSIIIITRNREEVIGRTLQTIVAQDFPRQEFELVVVDNGSKDDTCGAVNRTVEGSGVEFRVVEEPVAGICRARNTGFRNANGDWIAYVDDDALLPEKWLAVYSKAIGKYTEAAAFGGPATLDSELKRPWWWTKWLDGTMSCQDYGESMMPYAPYTHPYGLNMVLRKKILEEYGGFDVRLDELTGSMADETDLFYRLMQDEHQLIYVPDARVVHSVMQDRLRLSELRKRAFRIGESLAYLDSRYATSNNMPLLKRFKRVMEIPLRHRSPALFIKEYSEWCGYASFRKKFHEV